MTQLMHQARPAGGPAAGPGWRPASVVVLRMAGFPFGWLDGLAAPDVAATARDALDAARRVERLADLGRSPDLHAAAGNRADRGVLRALSRGRPYQARQEEPSPAFAALLADLTEALGARDATAAAFEAGYRRACELTGHHLVDLFRSTPALRDMLLVSNEDAYPRLMAWLDKVPPDARKWRYKDRYNLTTLVRYIQRVCAKNETTSHFGPLAPGRLDGDASGVTWTPAGLDRRTMLSRWAADALARHIAEDPTTWPSLCPRKAPGAVLDGDLIHIARLDQTQRTTDVRTAIRVGTPVRLDRRQRLIYELCDGESSIAHIAARAGEPDVHTVLAHLRTLADLGAVIIGPELLYGVEDPLAALRDWVANLGEAHPARSLCDDVADAVGGLAAAGTASRPAALGRLKQLITTATGEPAYRGHGGFYRDRSVFSEDCVGMAGDLVVGEPLVTRMRADLGLLYDMFLLRPRWRLRLERELLATWFARRFGRAGTVTAPRYLAAFLDDLTDLERSYTAIDERVTRIGDELEAALLPPGDDPAHVHTVDRRTVERLVERYGIAEPAMCNPDLMVAASGPEQLARGDFRLVIGDLHAMDDHLSHGNIAPFVDAAFPHYRSELLDLYAEMLGPGEHIADVTQFHPNKTFLRTEPAGWDIEAFGRSGRPATYRMRLGDLTIGLTNDRLSLFTPTHHVLRLMIPPHAWPMLRRNPFAVFAFPTSTTGAAVHGTGRSHLPRIQVGNVVLQRELWRLSTCDLASGDTTEEPATYLRVQALRERLHLPRHVFAKCPGEPKPVYCDLDSPLLVRQLTRMAAAATDQHAELTLSEMLPGPDDLWLADPAGARTCEIRYAVFSQGDTSPLQ